MTEEETKFHAERRYFTKYLTVDERRLTRLFVKGRQGIGWYDGALDALRLTYGDDAELVAQFIAATSPLKPVPRSVHDAMDAYTRFVTGEPLGVPALGIARSVIVRNLQRAVEGQPIHGPKCSAFAANILGDPDAVTVDRWIWRIFFGQPHGHARRARFIQAWITRNARRLGIAPRDYQAALWVGIKLESGVRADETIEPLRDVIARCLEEGGDDASEVCAA